MDKPLNGTSPKHEGPAAVLSDLRLTYDHGETWALDGIDLTLARHERVCVLGANGSGKSTLANVLAGLIAPDQGSVQLAGHDVYGPERGMDAEAYRLARHDVGLVFQDPEDQIVTTVVEDDVAFGPENLCLDPAEIKRRVSRELHRVGLQDRAGADPTEMSGGQQQRVTIAGTLAMRPGLLVLDEPGAMLDVRGRRSIMEVTSKLAAAGTTIVHITHYVEEALEADRVLVLRKGRIALDGAPDEVFSHADVMDDLHLELPFSARLVRELARRGVNVPWHADRSKVAAAIVSACTGAKKTSEPPMPVRRLPRNSANALDIQQASFAYERPQVLNDVSLSVGAGELVALVGQTGSGKSTLARVAAALERPDAGTARVCGISTQDKRNRRELRRKVGYVMQKPERQLFAPTVLEDVAFGPQNLGLSKDEAHRRAHEMLEHLGVGATAGKSPFELSGGQQRLAALAGVLVMEPELIIMDEPLSGLDPQARSKVRALIDELVSSGTAILMITHSMDDAAHASRIIVLDKGSVTLEGTPRDVFAHGDELSAIGLGVPDAMRVGTALRRAGASLDRLPLTIDELADALAGEVA